MKPRQLKWDDLNINNSRTWRNGVREVWKNRKGETKVHASLKGCAFVNKLFWILEFNESDPVQRARILLDMHKALVARMKNIQQYVADDQCNYRSGKQLTAKQLAENAF